MIAHRPSGKWGQSPGKLFGCCDGKVAGLHMGVEPKIGENHPKWMIYNGKPYKKWDDLGGNKPPLFLETSISAQ